MQQYPLPEIEEKVKKNRKIGLGVMGFADALIKLKVRYGSDDSVRIAGGLMEFINYRAYGESVDLAKEKGAAPNIKDEELRNTVRTVIAPTGSISYIAGASSGIEPNFAFEYNKNVMDSTFTEYHPLYKEWKDNNDSDLPDYFITASEVKPEEHVRIQAAFQEFTNNAVSKTVNLPNEATIEDVERVYKLAYELNCKGVTVYRDGSRKIQVLDKKTAPAEEINSFIEPQERPDITKGYTTKVPTGCGSVWLTVNFDDNDMLEIFARPSTEGGCQALMEGLARLISLCKRCNVSNDVIIDQLQSVVCPASIKSKRTKCKSCPDVLAKSIINLIDIHKGQKTNNNLEKVSNKETVNPCPECGERLTFAEGCHTCYNCGYSKCS